MPRAPSMRRPVSTSSVARPRPTRRGSRWVPAVPWDQAAGDVGQAEPGAARSDAQVTGERQLQSLVYGVPVDGGDHRFL